MELTKIGPCAMIAAALACAMTTLGAQTAPATGLSEWRELPNGGSIMRLVGGDHPSPTELAAFRVRYPPEFQSDSGAHYHFGTEHVTVLAGTLVLGFGERLDRAAAKEYGPGSFVVIPAGTPHFEWMKGDVLLHVESIGDMRAVWLTHAGGRKGSTR